MKKVGIDMLFVEISCCHLRILAQKTMVLNDFQKYEGSKFFELLKEQLVETQNNV